MVRREFREEENRKHVHSPPQFPSGKRRPGPHSTPPHPVQLKLLSQEGTERTGALLGELRPRPCSAKRPARPS